MKISSAKLKQIIKEEIEALTEEDESIEDLMKAIEDFESMKNFLKKEVKECLKYQKSVIKILKEKYFYK